MCTELLPPGGYPTAVNKYIISFQRNEQKMSALLTLFDKNKRLQSCEALVTLFGMVTYNYVSSERTTSIRKVEE
jgi:hypothetical protein